MRGVVGPRVRTGRFASHIDFRSARGLSEAEEGHGPEDARTRRTGTRLDRADVGHCDEPGWRRTWHDNLDDRQARRDTGYLRLIIAAMITQLL